MLRVYRSLVALAFIVQFAAAFSLAPFAARTVPIAPGLAHGMPMRAMLPMMDAAAADDKAAKAAATKAKAAKAKAAKAEAAKEDAPEAKEETAEEKEAREAAEKAEAEAKAKAEAEAEAAKKKAEEEAAIAAERKAAAIQEARAALNMAGKDFGYNKEAFVVRWTEEAIVEGDGNWAALTDEVPDLCDNIGVAKAMLERGDAKCVAIIKALDQLQVALTGQLAAPAADLVPTVITIKNRKGLVAKSYAREKSLSRDELLKFKAGFAREGGRLW